MKPDSNRLLKWPLVVPLVFVMLPLLIRVLSGLAFVWTVTSFGLLVVVWITFQSNLVSPQQSLRDRFRPIAFTQQDNWIKELNQIDLNSTYTGELYPENFLINDTLNNIVSLILRDFVERWFTRISKDETFLVDLKVQFGSIITRISDRLRTVDMSSILVHRLIPIVNEHMTEFAKACDLLKSRKSSLGAKDLDRIIAHNYNKGRLHPAVDIDSTDPETDIKTWLSADINKLLPLLLDEEETASPPVLILVREILASCVFWPVVKMLSDPDFYNQRIVTGLKRIMKDRNDVKRLLYVLNQHSDTIRNPPISQSFIARPESLTKMRISVKTSAKAFRKVLKNIAICDSTRALQQYRILLTIQLNELAKAIEVGGLNVEDDRTLNTYSKRLQILLAAVDARYKDLNGSPDTSSTSSSPPTRRRFDSVTLPKNATVSFDEVLSNPIQLPYFTEFMETRNRTVLIQFWLAVNALRNPLEDFYLGEEDTDYVNDEMSQADEIRQIAMVYFPNPMLKISVEDHDAVMAFADDTEDDPRLYHRARRTLFSLQETVKNRMDQTDFTAFKQSDFFVRMLAESIQSKLPPTNSVQDDEDEVNGDPLAEYDEVDSSDERDDEKVGDTVMQAVEDALNEITNVPSLSEDIVEDTSMSRSVSSLHLSKGVQKDVFGNGADDSSLFEYGSDSMISDTSKLLDEDSVDEMSASGELLDSASGKGGSHEELKIAAPGDLNLTREISTLQDDLNRLQEQVLIIGPLIEKASLTSNTAELTILNKAKLTLERQIQQKDLQVQQYTVQQSESSLYARTRVSIQSFISAKENGKDYILYLLEVQRLSSDDPRVVVAGWMVARRFSQFYQLHKYLQAKYPQITEVNFPKRKMVMNFLQASLIRERKAKLEFYLRALLEIRPICTDKVFRDFLSSDTFSLDVNQRNAASMTTKLYNRLMGQFMYLPQEESQMAAREHTLRHFNSTPEMNEELSMLDEDIEDDDENDLTVGREGRKDDFPFVRPLCDLAITFFQLNRSKVWLRGRAIALILQQLLGSTIEKVVRVNIDDRLKKESNVFALLIALQDSLWPNGEFRQSGKERSLIEKDRVKRQARYMLTSVTMDTCSKLFGTSNSKHAAERLFDLMQNEILNRHLTLMLLKEVMTCLFPEMAAMK